MKANELWCFGVFKLRLVSLGVISLGDAAMKLYKAKLYNKTAPYPQLSLDSRVSALARLLQQKKRALGASGLPYFSS